MFRVPVHIVTEEDEAKQARLDARWWGYLKIYLMIQGFVFIVLLLLIFFQILSLNYY